MNFLANSVHFTLVFAAIFTLASLAALFCERAGIINISIDGFMIFGATSYCFLGWAFGATNALYQIPIFLISGLLTGMLALIFYGLCVKTRANHIIAGIVMNTIATTIAISVLLIVSARDPDSNNYRSIAWRYLHDLTLYEYLDRAADRYKFSRILSFSTILTIVMVLATWYGFEKTKWGLHYKAVGENPNAANSVGINVYSVQRQACFLSGFFSAIAGQIFVSAILESINSFTGSVGGLGFISITMLIIGRWHVLKVTCASVLFALFYALSQTIQYEPSINVEEYTQFLLAAPFLITILFLVISSIRVYWTNDSWVPKLRVIHRDTSAPAHLGRHYDKNLR